MDALKIVETYLKHWLEMAHQIGPATKNTVVLGD